MPSLLGRKSDAIAKQLGAPTKSEITGDSKRETFARGDYLLTLEVLARNNRVTSFQITPAEGSIKDENKDELLRAAQLREGDPRYSLDFVEDPDHVGRVAGLKVTVAPITHTVALRVESGSQIITVRVTGAPAKVINNPEFQTFPPYNETFTAQTGTIIGLQAEAFSTRGATATPVNAQILVDGKVAAQNNASAGTAHCSIELD